MHCVLNCRVTKENCRTDGRDDMWIKTYWMNHRRFKWIYVFMSLIHCGWIDRNKSLQVRSRVFVWDQEGWTKYPMVSEALFILQRSFLVRIIIRRLILSLFHQFKVIIGTSNKKGRGGLSNFLCQIVSITDRIYTLNLKLL